MRVWTLLKNDNIIIIEGKISIKEEENAKIICEKIIPIKNSKVKKNTEKAKTSKLYIKINTQKNPEILEVIKKILGKNRGEQPVYVVDEAKRISGKSVVMKADRSIWVNINDNLIYDLKRTCGNECVALK